MSSSYREQSNKAKDVRRGVTEQKSTSPKAPKRKDILVEYRTNPSHPFHQRSGGSWQKWGKYRTLEEAQKTIKTQMRKYPNLWEFRIAP
jgi:hypothetical protein